MGRPINKKFFADQTPGTGSQSVASVTITSPTVSTGTVTVTIAAPDLAGTTAIASAVKTGNTVTSITVTTPGSGYTLPPVVTIAESTGNGTVGTATAQIAPLTAESGNLNANAKVVGSTTVNPAVVNRQVSSKRYFVQTIKGGSVCELVASDTLDPGQMNLIAKDTTGSTYWVTKLTARRALLTRRTSVGAGYVLADGTVTNWTMSAATGTTVTVGA